MIHHRNTTPQHYKILWILSLTGLCEKFDIPIHKRTDIKY